MNRNCCQDGDGAAKTLTEAPSPSPAAHRGRNRILCVDDDPLNLDILDYILNEEFELVMATSGEEAIRLAKEVPPDLILLDIMMPGIDGHEVCRRIRSDSVLHAVKVILISAKAQTDDRLDGYAAGADDYITKPFDGDELLAKVRVFFRLKSAEEERDEMHRERADLSRQAGMAEVATGVLHNVGNVLNGVNIAATQAQTEICDVRLDEFVQVARLFQANKDRLSEFVTQDERGRSLPEFLSLFGDHLASTREKSLRELELMLERLDHIKQIIMAQQSFAKVARAFDSVAFADVVEDALRIYAVALGRHGVKVCKEYADVPPVQSDRHLALQILINLLSNAKHACSVSDQAEKVITVQLESDQHEVRIIVQDNGVGIPQENLDRIFQHGFTTRPDGHGFGLHSAALSARELGGKLTVSSAGEGKGARFQLHLPVEGPSAGEEPRP